MIKSMTGFGRSEKITDKYKLSVELKSVNHRYFDLSIKMPKRFNFFESSIRMLLKEYVQRGKIDLYINYEDYTDEQVNLKYNKSIAQEYMNYFKQMEDDFGIVNDISVATLSRFQDVLVMEEIPEDEDMMWSILSIGIREASEQFVDSREHEGNNLAIDFADKLDYMSELLSAIEERAPKILSEYRNKLEDKTKELLSGTQIEESRIAAEVIIYADKICVDEETVRLRSHIEATRRELMSGGSIGRKLDFIAQEMNREANTILSKSTDLSVSDKAITLKTEIEKIREQVQNIE